MEGWKQGGDYVLDADGRCVCATSEAGAYAQRDNWAQMPATLASDKLAKAIADMPEVLQALREAYELMPLGSKARVNWLSRAGKVLQHIGAFQAHQ